MSKLYYSASALAFLIAAAAQAQTTELREIVVSGGLSPIELRKSGRSVTVIDAETLEKNQIKFVADALRLVPGMQVSRLGSTGGQTTARIRGGDANHVLIVLDGVAINDIDQGAAYLENLLASDIEQIEVLRGPQSALWGSNAASGVINITTKSGVSGQRKSVVSTEIGTNKSWLTNLSTRGGSEAVRYAVSGAFNRVNGFNIATVGDENDRDRNATVNAKLSLDFNEATTLDTHLRYVDRKSDYDDTNSGIAKDADYYLVERTLSGGATLKNVALDGALTQRLSANFRKQKRNSFDAYRFLSDGHRYTAGYNATYRYDEIDGQVHQLTAGYEWLREDYQSNYMNGKATRRTHSAIAEYRGEFWDQFYLTAGLRQDWNSDFSNATTWNVSGDWKLQDGEIRLHSAVGTAVAKPTFYEQFANSSVFVGNPNLKPEKSFGWDFGVEKTFFDGGLVLDVTYFNQNLTNEISGAARTVVNNDGESKRQGVEVSAKVDFFNGLTTTASYTYTDATSQKSLSDPRLQSIRRPKHAASLSTAYVFDEERARIYANLILNGTMPDDNFGSFPAGRVSLGGYTVVNIGGSYKLNESVDIFARVENLFNKKYTEVYGYNTPGIAGFAGVRASF